MEGSFNVSKNNYKLVFCIGQSEKDLVLMQEIKNFFYSIAPSSNLGEGVGFSSTKRYPHMPYAVINLLVQNQNFIANVLIPFFDSRAALVFCFYICRATLVLYGWP